MKSTLSILLLSVFSLFSLTQASTGQAHQTKLDTGESSIVCISGQRVISESQFGQDIQSRLQAEQEKLTKPLQAEEKRIQERAQKLESEKSALDGTVADFEKNAKTLTTESRAQKLEQLQERAQKIEDEKRELDRMWQKLQAEAKKVESKMQSLYQQEMGKLDALVKTTISEMAQQFGWKIVLMEEQLVFASPNSSKTKEVIAKLDEKYKAAKLAKKEAVEAKQKPTPEAKQK